MLVAQARASASHAAEWRARALRAFDAVAIPCSGLVAENTLALRDDDNVTTCHNIMLMLVAVLETACQRIVCNLTLAQNYRTMCAFFITITHLAPV